MHHNARFPARKLLASLHDLAQIHSDYHGLHRGRVQNTILRAFAIPLPELCRIYIGGQIIKV